jgi:hypothetical protein
MKINDFMRIVRRLGNSSYVRYWLHWRLISEATEQVMVLASLNLGETNQVTFNEIPELEQMGFRKYVIQPGTPSEGVYYAIARAKDEEAQRDGNRPAISGDLGV